MSKQTCANNAFLRGVKKTMNKKIYARVCKLYNTTDQGRMSGGEGVAVMYLQQFFNRPITAAEFETDTLFSKEKQ